jgi:hypothetical protein
MAGRIEKKQPDANPYMLANSIYDSLAYSPVVPELGNHSESVAMPPKMVQIIMTLKTPILSPKYAGTIRPRMDTPLSMETRYRESSTDIPWSCA